MSDSELDRSAEKLVCAEKQNVAKLIAPIAEMSRRKVTLELGYKSTLYLVRIEPKPVFQRSIRRRPARPVPVESARAERPEHKAEILEQALDVALDKKDPKRKLERRKARQ